MKAATRARAADPEPQARWNRPLPAGMPRHINSDIQEIWRLTDSFSQRAHPEDPQWVATVHREALHIMQNMREDGGSNYPALFKEMPDVPPAPKVPQQGGSGGTPVVSASGLPLPAPGGTVRARMATVDPSRASHLELLWQLTEGLHKGEIADVGTCWEAVATPLPNQQHWYQDQFQLGGPAEPDGVWDYGKESGRLARWDASAPGGASWVYTPDWGRQVNRWLVACPANRWHWRRVADVTTLAHLFHALGRNFSARAIYAYYLELRLVACKKWRGKRALARRSRSEAAHHVAKLVPDVCRDLGLPVPDGRRQVALICRSLTAYVAALSVAAVRPRWLEEDDVAVPSGEADAGGSSLSWQIARSGLLRAQLSALPCNVVDALRSQVPPMPAPAPAAALAPGSVEVIVQPLFRCPKLVEAGCARNLHHVAFCACVVLVCVLFPTFGSSSSTGGVGARRGHGAIGPHVLRPHHRGKWTVDSPQERAAHQELVLLEVQHAKRAESQRRRRAAADVLARKEWSRP